MADPSQHQPLLTKKTYSVPSGSGIPDPTDITFSYDALGNRTQMTDGLGTKTYAYDSLSRMMQESLALSDTSTPFPSNTATLNYTYTISNQLKSYAMPFTVLQVNYDFDKRGRLNNVSGAYGSTNYTYASNPHYRAWGLLTHLDYSNGTEMNVGGLNNRLQGTTFSIKKGTTQIIDKTYEFYSDASVKKETDAVDARFDRSYQYDNLSRMVEARTGAEARGQTDSASNIPYRTSYQYDQFGHQSYMTYKHYSHGPFITETPYQNNRMVVSGVNYDKEGNVIQDVLSKVYDFDAAGQLSHTDFEVADGNGYVRNQEFMTYDGDGLLGKVTTSDQEGEEAPATTSTSYRVHSTVLNGEVVWNDAAPYILANGTRIATAGDGPVYHHKDPNLKSFRSTNPSGTVMGSGTTEADWDQIETDADGKKVDFVDPGEPINWAPTNNLFDPSSPFGSIENGQFVNYSVDGIMVTRDHYYSMMESAFGGQLGIVERQARMSVRSYSVKYRGETKTYEAVFKTEDEARDFAFEKGQNTVYRNIEVSTSWSIIASVVSFDPQQDCPQDTNNLFPFSPCVKKRPLTKDEVANLKKNVETLLDANDGKCKRYIEQLLDKTNELFPHGEDGNTIIRESGLKERSVSNIFSLVEKQGGFYFAYNTAASMFKDKPEYNGARVWLIGDNGLDPQTRTGPDALPYWQAHSRDYDQANAFTAIHELIHYNFNDNQLARATAALNEDKNPDFSGFFGTSNYWNEGLRRHCDPSWRDQDHADR